MRKTTVRQREVALRRPAHRARARRRRCGFHLERETEENVRRGMTPAAGADRGAAPVRRRREDQGRGPRRRTAPAPRDDRAGRPLRPAVAPQEPGLRGGGRPDARARHRRQHRDLLGRPRRAAAVAALRRRRAARAHPRGCSRRRRHGRRLLAARDGGPRRPRATRSRASPSTTRCGSCCSGRDEPERVQTGVVSANFFDLLGVKPLLGRTFRTGEDKHGAEAVLVLSHDYWMRSFGGDPKVVGRVFTMNDRPHTVVGVLPPIPGLPRRERRLHADLGLPVPLEPSTWRPTATPGCCVGLRAAEAGRHAGGGAQGPRATSPRSWQNEYPENYPPRSRLVARARCSLPDELTRQARPTFLVLPATVGLVLLLACANVANLTPRAAGPARAGDGAALGARRRTRRG